MASWAERLPRAAIVRRDQATPVTLILPFYQNPQFLRRQIEQWRVYPRDLVNAFSVIVVDDGSPTPAVEALRGVVRPSNFRLFRIEQDIRWNWLAARNIGAYQATDGWLLLTDMDHVLPAETLRSIVYGVHDPETIYVFSRREHTGKAIAPHSASFLMTRAMFWRVGGYDERCSGFYGSDGLWRRRCEQVAPIRLLSDELVRYEFQGDSSTTTYQRKQSQDVGLHALVASFPKGSAPLTMSFAYHEVAL